MFLEIDPPTSIHISIHDFAVQIWILHAIPGKNFWALDPIPIHGQKYDIL